MTSTDGYRVAVVGGGIFGVTTAIHLARAGNRVVLFEAGPDILRAASNVNQRRLHRGYHYPRSAETAMSARAGAESFVAEYPEAIRSGDRHYMAIARRDSMVSAGEYLEFCRRMGLTCREEYPSFLRRSSVEVSLRVDEHSIDVEALRGSCWRKLASAGVAVRLRSRRHPSELTDFEWVVVATYASLNQASGSAAVDYQYEVCEKPVVRLPPRFHGHSVVILDGPFTCLDPLDRGGRFLLGNVVHAIHATTIGRYPLVPARLARRVNGGLCRLRETRFPEFVSDAREFFSGIGDAEHLGSLFTIRAVLPYVEESDERPTIVRMLDERTLSVFGGKISTCVEAAKAVSARIARRDPSRPPPEQVAVAART